MLFWPLKGLSHGSSHELSTTIGIWGASVNKQRSLALASVPSVTIFNLLLMVDMSRPPHRHYAPQGQVDVISTFIHPFMVSYALGTQC